jgi:hypothetical protein
MLYIHQSCCISPQQTFQQTDLETLKEPVEKKLMALEPGYEGIPPGILRRMGKAIRMGVGAGMPIIKSAGPLNGIIIGTANGGMEDCIKFLNQIVQYDEGVLAPGNFVQSTTNAIAAQLGLLSGNRSYNITHVHLGHSFENALMDASMQLKENPEGNYLVGGVDEISTFHYNIEKLAGAFKEEDISNKQLYSVDSPGSIAGEAGAMFLVNNKKEDAVAKLQATYILHSSDEDIVKDRLQQFIAAHLQPGKTIDLFLSGEDGDNRIIHFYKACENLMDKEVTIARFKHLCGDFPTASAFGSWLACELFRSQTLPGHMLKRGEQDKQFSNILLYNNFKGLQHSFILLSKN